MSLGSRSTPIVLEDIGRDFDSTDNEAAANSDHDGDVDDQLYHDERSNTYSTIELHERTEQIHIGTKPSATITTLDGLTGATRWQVNRRFGDRSIRCR